MDPMCATIKRVIEPFAGTSEQKSGTIGILGDVVYVVEVAGLWQAIGYFRPMFAEIRRLVDVRLTIATEVIVNRYIGSAGVEE